MSYYSCESLFKLGILYVCVCSIAAILSYGGIHGLLTLIYGCGPDIQEIVNEGIFHPSHFERFQFENLYAG